MALKKRQMALTLVAAATLSAPAFIYPREGDSLKSYLDVGKIWTACHGVAHVKPNHTYTRTECNAMDASALGQKIRNVAKLIKVPITLEILVAHTSFAYNVGMGNYQKSQVLLKTNKNHLEDGCDAMLSWYKAGGRDCRLDHWNPIGCYGVWTRRQGEKKMCMEGTL